MTKTPPTLKHTVKFKGRKIGPCNWKTLKNLWQQSRECCYSLGITAAAYHLQYNLKSISIPVPKNALLKNPNDQLLLQINKNTKAISLCTSKTVILTKNCGIEQQAFIKSLKNITLFTQIYQFCANQWQTIETCYILGSPKKIFDLLKGTQDCACPLTKCLPIPKKLFKTVQARNEQANLQPTLNKEGDVASLTIYVTDCLQN